MTWELSQGDYTILLTKNTGCSRNKCIGWLRNINPRFVLTGFLRLKEDAVRSVIQGSKPVKSYYNSGFNVSAFQHEYSDLLTGFPSYFVVLYVIATLLGFQLGVDPNTKPTFAIDFHL